MRKDPEQMNFRQNQGPRFSVNSRRWKKTYPFERMSPDDPDFKKAMISAYAMTFMQDLDAIEELNKKMSSAAPALYVRICKFVLERMSDKSLTETNYLKPFCQNAEKSIQNRQILLAHLLASDNPDLRASGADIIPKMCPKAVAEATAYCKRVYGKFPGRAKNAVRKYLRRLEEDEHEFDSALFNSKKHLKYLYASLHIRPSERAQKILFDNDPPAGSLAEAVKSFRTEYDSELICRLIDKFSVDSGNAVRTIKFMSSKTARRIISGMSPEELLRSLPILRAKGITKDDETAALISDKLKELPPKKKESDVIRVRKYIPKPETHFKSLVYKCLLSLIKRKLSIRKRIALLIDASGSMYAHRDTGRSITSILSALVDKENGGELEVWLFSDKAERLDISDKDWEAKYNDSFKSYSGTSPGCALKAMAESGSRPETVIIISDGNENTPPLLSEGYDLYAGRTGIMPYPVFIKDGYYSSRMERNLENSDLTCYITEFSDYETTIGEIGSFIFSESFEESVKT